MICAFFRLLRNISPINIRPGRVFSRWVERHGGFSAMATCGGESARLRMGRGRSVLRKISTRAFDPICRNCHRFFKETEPPAQQGQKSRRHVGHRRPGGHDQESTRFNIRDGRTPSYPPADKGARRDTTSIGRCKCARTRFPHSRAGIHGLGGVVFFPEEC